MIAADDATRPAGAGGAGGAGGADIVVVCTANQCRSPMAEFLLRAAAGAAGRAWTVESAGTHAREGTPVAPEVLTVLAERGVPATDRGAHRLSPRDLTAAGLVLTAERAHRSIVLRDAPSLVGRVFTVLEFDRLLTAAQQREPSRRARDLGEVVAWAESARAHAGPGGEADDLTDPIGRPLADYRRCADALERVVHTLFAATGHPSRI